MKTAFLILLLLVFTTLPVHAEVDEDAITDSTGATTPEATPERVPANESRQPTALATPAAPIATVSADADEDHTDTPLEACLFSIYRGRPSPPQDGDEVDVIAYPFDTDFYTRTNFNELHATSGYSFFFNN